MPRQAVAWGWARCGGGHHDQLFGPVGEQFGEGQADHAAVGAADEGGDPLDPQMVQHQSQQTRLVVGGDGDGRSQELGAGGEIDGQNLEPAQVDGAAHRHGARPPAQAVGLGAVDETPGRNAAGDDDDRRPDATVQTTHDIGLVQLFARGQAEVGGDGHDDVAGAAAFARRFAHNRRVDRLGPTEGLFEQGCFSQGHQSSSASFSPQQGLDAVTDRGASPRRCSTHLSRPEGPRRSWHRFGRNPMVAPASKGLIPQPVLMSDFTLIKQAAPVKRKIPPICGRGMTASGVKRAEIALSRKNHPRPLDRPGGRQSP